MQLNSIDTYYCCQWGGFRISVGLKSGFLIGYVMEKISCDDLKNGDLFFVRDDSDFSRAIIETTEAYSHVGIFFDGMIYHASRKLGVAKQSLDDFLSDEKKEIHVYRYPDIDCDSVRNHAEKYIGYEYNHGFYPGNDSFYCSQYIAEILPIFDPIPMEFGDGKKDVSEYWENYYRELGLAVPLGLPGTNPGQLAKSEKLNLIGKLL